MVLTLLTVVSGIAAVTQSWPLVEGLRSEWED